jgi:poly(3-hydroxybutyrate) depolymerase
MKKNQRKHIEFLIIGGMLFAFITLTGCMYKIPQDPHTYVRTMLFDDLQRSYHIHIPSSFPENITPALVFVLHGGGDTGEGMERTLTLGGFNSLAD